jgi:hypothetical protein
MRGAIEAGIFGVVLMSVCSMSLGLLSRLASLDPIVYFASLAGVMAPLVMVTVGGLARWASNSPFRPAGAPGGPVVAASLVAGLASTAGAALLFALALMVCPGGVFFSGMPWTRTGSLNAYGWMEVAVLLASYVALAVIGGLMYGIVAPESHARY